MKRLAPPLLLLVILTACGCSKLTPAYRSYVQADRQTFDALKPILNAYVQEHPGSPTTRPLADTVESWELRIQNAEQTLQQQ